MDSDSLKIACKIIISKSAADVANERLHLMAYNPPSNISMKLGELFLLIDLKNADKNAGDTLRNLVSSIGKAFYDPKLRSLSAQFNLACRSARETIARQEISCDLSLIAIHAGQLLHASYGGPIIFLERNENTLMLSKDGSGKLEGAGHINLQAEDKIVLTSLTTFEKIGRKNISALATLPHKDAENLLKKMIGDNKNQDKSYGLMAIGAQQIDLNKSIGKQATAKNDEAKKKNTENSLAAAKSKFLVGANGKTKMIAAAFRQFFKRNLPKILGGSKRFWTDSWTKYVNPNPQKALIVVLITTIIIVVSIWLSVSNLRNSDSPEKTLENAQMLIGQADDAISKNNQSSAEQYLNKASDILKTIKKADQNYLDSQFASKKIRTSYTVQSERYGLLQDKLQSVVRIPTANSFEIGLKNLAALAYANQSLLGIDKNSGTIININPLFGSPRTLASNAELKSTQSSSVSVDQNLIVLTQNSVYSYNQTAGLVNLKVSGMVPSSSIDSFGNNIYLLSQPENQIYKWTRASQNLTNKTPLLKNIGADKLKGASSMIVTSNIFVSKGRSILLFESGQERSFRLNGLPENFGDIKSLVYNNSKNYFLALNSQSTRIALLKLDAESADFNEMYALKDDAKISSFTIDEQTSQLFVNYDSKIVSFNLEKK